MALNTYNIAAEQGSTYAATVTYNDSLGAPVSLVGASASLKVRRFTGSPEAQLTLGVSNGLTLGGALGTVAISISAAALSAVPAGQYTYDLEVVLASGSSVKLIGGTFTVAAEVTR